MKLKHLAILTDKFIATCDQHILNLDKELWTNVPEKVTCLKCASHIGIQRNELPK